MTGGAQIQVNANGTFEFNRRGLVNYLTVNTSGLRSFCMAIACGATSQKAFLNGALAASRTGTVDFIFNGSGTFDPATDETLALHLEYDSALPDAVAQSLSVNPWQEFEDAEIEDDLSADVTSISVALAWTDANDAAAITGVLTNRANAVWAEASDTLAATGTITDRASLAWSEQGETAALTGIVQEPAQSSITAAIAWTEASETAATVVRLTNRAAITIAEQDDSWLLEVVADSLETPAAAASAVNIYTIMRNEPVNVSARLGGAVNLIGNLI